jgi:hypothetical protein
MFLKRHLVNKKLLKSILDQMAEAEALHNWSAEGVIKHFA